MDSKREEEILNLWKRNKVYEKTKRQSKPKKRFYFLDGPPYATGHIHLGTAWNKILKDIYIRFWRMTGFDTWDQPGYDTHGLPIENKVEKELQIKSKSDIERIGIEKFILACRDYATRFIGTMNNQFENLGVWMDWGRPYVTLDNDYIEGAWHTFKIAYDNGFLYRGLYPVHVCPHCETAVAYNEIEYAKVTDPSIFVKFRVKPQENSRDVELSVPTFLIIWTTTPWTLPANTGVMAKPDADYVHILISDQIWIIAKELLETMMSKLGYVDYKIIKTVKGKELEGLEYTHPLANMLAYQRELKKAHRVVLSDQYVTLDTGTGLVHTAPGHGQEDYKVGLENKLPALSPVNLNGTFTEETGELSGIFVKHADRIIIDKLKERGLLVLEEKISHDYPQCWRCNSPLLLISVSQWFFKVTKIRDKLIKENNKINWYPKWAGQRFGNWLENLGDWPISRQRYWGIPLPIWICEDCKLVRVVGSAKELKSKINDLHRPYIDKVTLKCKCGGIMRRIPDVLDVWFDSGLASWASLGYPKTKSLFRMWPADLNIEGPDQIRGWWNSQLITSVITFGKAPFKSILFHGFTLDAHGSKMSKSKGNIVTPEEVVQKYGRDVLRYYLVSSPAWDDFYFKWIDVDAVAKSFTVIENTFNFVKTYVAKPKVKMPVSKLKPEDKWILSRLNFVIDAATQSMQAYSMHKAAVEVNSFILNDFSRWYIKLVRERTWPAYTGKDKDAAFYTLYHVAAASAKLLSIFCPFLAEKAWQDVCRPLGSKEESVHLCSWPKAEKKMISKKAEDAMALVKEISETVNALRKEHELKLRWPVEKVVVETKDPTAKAAVSQFRPVIEMIANSKKAETGYGSEDMVVKNFSKGRVFVSKNVLKEEALLRELLREIQDKRKQRKLIVTQKIILHIDNHEMKKYEKEIKQKVGAAKVSFGTVDEPYGEVEIEGVKVKFKFSLVK